MPRIWPPQSPAVFPLTLLSLPGTAHFSNVARYAAETLPDVLFIRVDAAITFCNTQIVRERVEREIHAKPQIQHVVLVMSAVNDVDTSGLFLLRECNNLMGSNTHSAHIKHRGVRIHRLTVQPSFQ